MLELHAFLELCHVLDGVAILVHGGIPDNWLRAIELWLQALKRAYPDYMLKPKHHQAIHCALQVLDRIARLTLEASRTYALERRRPMVFPLTFPLERKNKAYKGFADVQCQQNDFERSIELQLLNQHIRELNTPQALATGTFFTGAAQVVSAALRDAVGADHIEASRTCSHNGCASSIGDVVFLKGSEETVVAKLLLHMRIEPKPAWAASSFCMLVEPLEKLDDREYMPTGEHRLAAIESLVAPAIFANWRMDGALRVLAPPEIEYYL